MASTTLFAPQVRAVQPAFIYGEDIREKKTLLRNGILYTLTYMATIEFAAGETLLGVDVPGGCILGTDAEGQLVIEESLPSYCFIDWGDGIIEDIRNTPFPFHVYLQTGRYQVACYGTEVKILQSNERFLEKNPTFRERIVEFYTYNFDVSNYEDNGGLFNQSWESLKSVILDDENFNKEMKIPSRTFFFCNTLEQVSFSKKVLTISTNAFSNCNKLNQINFLGTESDWESITIESNSGLLDSIKLKYINYYSLAYPLNLGAFLVYFNLSPLNSINDIKNILCTLIDPNQSSTWGSNSILKKSSYLFVPFAIKELAAEPVQDREYYTLNADGEYEYKGKLTSFKTGTDYYYFNRDPKTTEYYINITLNEEDYKELVFDQFYQMQLYFTDLGIDKSNIDQWAIENEDHISDPSQVTLIRPIRKPYISIDQDKQEVYNFSKLTGRISSVDKETFDSYSYKILNKYFKTEDASPTSEKTYYTFNEDTFDFTLFEGNSFTNGVDYYECISIEKNGVTVTGSGKSFEIPLDNTIIQENGIYTLKFLFTTSHGYSPDGGINVTVQYKAPDIGGPNVQVTVEEESGAIKIKPEQTSDIQRESEDCLGYWKTVAKNVSTENDWIDYTIESNTKYRYRAVAANKTGGSSEEKEIKFDDIFLSDETAMVAVRYNPNINSFKYVTQESITNTLGGKFPIIRRNGDTKYRQFTLSGTIDCGYYESQGIVASSIVSNQSNSNPLIRFYYNDSNIGSLYLTNMESLRVRPTAKNINDQRKELIEREIRKLTVDFLTNGRPKLFRSFEEGNMIVYLSNISFTPNRQLSRHIYDFSATVTEVCEYTSDNLSKYGLNSSVYKRVQKED